MEYRNIPQNFWSVLFRDKINFNSEQAFFWRIEYIFIVVNSQAHSLPTVASSRSLSTYDLTFPNLYRN